MRHALPDDFDPVVVATIQSRLDEIEAQTGSTIIVAIESGSRAWGFASADSDYDCRFIYMRPRDDYLTLWDRRDVIETPLDAVLDVNGWDLTKALRLIAKGNAVALEWLASPICYRDHLALRSQLIDFAQRFADRPAVRRHYFHLFSQQFDRHLAGRERWSIKGMFYAVRPALSLAWLAARPEEAIAPMNLWQLLDETDQQQLAPTLRRHAELKASGMEADEVDGDGLLRSWLVAQLAQNADHAIAHPPVDSDRMVVADVAFRAILSSDRRS